MSTEHMILHTLTYVKPYVITYINQPVKSMPRSNMWSNNVTIVTIWSTEISQINQLITVQKPTY